MILIRKRPITNDAKGAPTIVEKIGTRGWGRTSDLSLRRRNLITYTDPVTGKRHDRQRRAESKTKAKDLLLDLLAEVDSTGGRSLANEHMTFHEVAEHFKTHYLTPAEYVEGRKISGVRSIAPAIRCLPSFRCGWFERDTALSTSVRKAP